MAASAATVMDGGSDDGGAPEPSAPAPAAAQPKQQGKKAAGSGKKQAKPKKPKKFIRTAGGQIWEDKSLHEWDQGEMGEYGVELGVEEVGGKAGNGIFENWSLVEKSVTFPLFSDQMRTWIPMGTNFHVRCGSSASFENI